MEPKLELSLRSKKSEDHSPITPTQIKKFLTIMEIIILRETIEKEVTVYYAWMKDDL